VAAQPCGARWLQAVSVADAALLKAKAAGRNQSVAITQSL
jgi:PleD family two-component response regulator